MLKFFFKILAVVDKLKIRNLTLERSLKRKNKFSDACDVALFIKLYMNFKIRDKNIATTIASVKFQD